MKIFLFRKFPKNLQVNNFIHFSKTFSLLNENIYSWKFYKVIFFHSSHPILTFLPKWIWLLWYKHITLYTFNIFSKLCNIQHRICAMSCLKCLLWEVRQWAKLWPQIWIGRHFGSIIIGPQNRHSITQSRPKKVHTKTVCKNILPFFYTVFGRRQVGFQPWKGEECLRIQHFIAFAVLLVVWASGCKKSNTGFQNWQKHGCTL